MGGVEADEVGLVRRSQCGHRASGAGYYGVQIGADDQQCSAVLDALENELAERPQRHLLEHRERTLAGLHAQGAGNRTSVQRLGHCRAGLRAIVEVTPDVPSKPRDLAEAVELQLQRRHLAA